MIRDMLVIGLLDKKCSKKLQLEANLTLERATEISRQAEHIKIEI